MKKLLVVVDMQNDFISGSLGTKEAEAIVPAVISKIKNYETNGDTVVFTLDTHEENYLSTMEGKNLPVLHCIRGTKGWEMDSRLSHFKGMRFEKPTFGSTKLASWAADEKFDDIMLVGLCTDICVISNAILLKASLPESVIRVDSSCCAGVTPQSNANALEAMKMCQIEVI